jgi:hypothetical protein
MDFNERARFLELGLNQVDPQRCLDTLILYFLIVNRQVWHLLSNERDWFPNQRGPCLGPVCFPFLSSQWGWPRSQAGKCGWPRYFRLRFFLSFHRKVLHFNSFLQFIFNQNLPRVPKSPVVEPNALFMGNANQIFPLNPAHAFRWLQYVV